MSRMSREFTRHEANLSVEVRTRSGWQPCTAVDVSRGGMFVKSQVSFDVGRVVQLRLHLPQGDPVTVLSQVRRTVMQVAGAGLVPGIGVGFFPMPPEVKARWDLYVMSLSESDRAHMAEALVSGPEMPSGGGAARRTSPAAHRTGPAARRTSPARPAAREQRPGTSTAGPRLRPRPPVGSRRKEAAYAPNDELPTHVVRVRPSNPGRLKRIIEQRLWGEPLTLRSKERVAVGQPVELVLVHHKTDAEFVIQAACAESGPADRAGHSTITLGFPKVDDTLKGGLTRFLRTGTRDQRHMGHSERELLDRRAERARRSPRDVDALVEHGWAVLAVEEKAEAAAEIFLAALALAERREDIHHALGICYALTGRTDLSYQFIRSSLRLQGGAVGAKANATADVGGGAGPGAGPAVRQDDIGLIRRR